MFRRKKHISDFNYAQVYANLELLNASLSDYDKASKNSSEALQQVRENEQICIDCCNQEGELVDKVNSLAHKYESMQDRTKRDAMILYLEHNLASDDLDKLRHKHEMASMKLEHAKLKYSAYETRKQQLLGK